uniref:Uncharacterized protein n=1 Tax=Arundo donax TaxID=35708 RepID=A0A0A8YHG8_ARUDO
MLQFASFRVQHLKGTAPPSRYIQVLFLGDSSYS